MAKFGKKNVIKDDIFSYNLGIIGEPGIGKTTLVKNVCEKVVGEDGYIILEVGKEDGIDAIDNAVYENVPTWKMFSEIVDDIVKNKKEDYPDLKVVAIDTIDELFNICEPYVIQLHNRENPEKRVKSIKQAFGGFMAGEDKCIELVLNKLWELKKVGVSFVIIGHTKMRNIDDMITGQSYTTLTTNMSQRYFNSVKTKLHVLGVCSIDREIVKEKTGKKNIVTKQEEVKGKTVSETRKITFRDDNYTIDSKSRFADIVDNIPLDADAFIKALKDAIKAAKSTKPKVSKPDPQPKQEMIEEPVVEEEEEIVEDVIEDVVEEELPFTTPEESESDDDLFAEEEEVESDYPEDLANVIPKMFKACADKDIQYQVKSLIRDYGSLSKMDEEGMRKAYDLMK